MAITTTDPDITLVTEIVRVTIGDQSGERNNTIDYGETKALI